MPAVGKGTSDMSANAAGAYVIAPNQQRIERYRDADEWTTVYKLVKGQRIGSLSDDDRSLVVAEHDGSLFARNIACQAAP